MKNIIQIFITVFITFSCNSQKINVNYKNIEINIPGTPGPWLKHNEKYYCYFKTDNDGFSSGSNHHFYIIDENGKINSKLEVPNELQTFYYDLYIKNDTIFTTEYYDHNTFFLDLKKKEWIKTKKGIDLYYEDENYSVYSLDFGEWGGVTWFKNRKTKKQYEIGCTSPIINKIDNSYFVTEGTSIIEIKNPENLERSKNPYDYTKAVLNEKYFREGSNSMKGAKSLFVYKDNDYFNPQFSIATSFVIDNKLYHLYKDSISTKIGTLKNNTLSPIYTFKSKIQPFNWHYDTRNQIQNNKYQTIQFRTDKENVYGIIEITNKKLNVVYFKNTFSEPIFGEKTIKKWTESTFDLYFSNFKNLELNTIDELEKKEKATNLTQRHKISHYLLDGKDVETPRIYRKIENSDFTLITMYYYTTKENRIELIEFEWKRNRNSKNIEDNMNSNKDAKIALYKSKFEWLSSYIQSKLGKPNESKKDKRSAEKKWEMNNIIISLSYSGNNLELRMYNK